MTQPLIMPADFTLLDGSIRYGVTRNVAATDAHGKPVSIAMAVIERESGAFECLAIPESKIRFAGEGIIEQEVKEACGL